MNFDKTTINENCQQVMEVGVGGLGINVLVRHKTDVTNPNQELCFHTFSVCCLCPRVDVPVLFLCLFFTSTRVNSQSVPGTETQSSTMI